MTNILVLGGRHWAVEDCLKIRKVDNTFWFLIIVARSSHVGFAPELGVLASFTRLGVTAWGWRDLRMKEQFQLTLDSQESCEEFKKALDESAGKNSLLGFIQNFWAWY